jgi:DNA repair protein RadA/Sms
MAKVKTQFQCQGCGTVSAKWLGRCLGCGEWNTLVEEKVESEPKAPVRGLTSTKAEPVALGARPETSESERRSTRLKTGLLELDRVLGGGLVPDSFVLIGGDPGIGKSTLLLQLARGISPSRVLYVSGEESVDQIASRAERLGVEGGERVFVLSETRLDRVFDAVDRLSPQVLIMDSLQTFMSSELESVPGSVSQVREVAARLMGLAKTKGIAVWLVGHVTKEGGIAGPKVVEHMVDTVLYFEGEGTQNFRLLRAVKNRFGSVRELGVFEMSSLGLQEVKNPSQLFLSDRGQALPGTAVTSSVEGTRPLMIEIQALVSTSSLAVPRRTAVGFENQRMALLAAILERHAGLQTAHQDIYLNVAGGIRLSEPGCDLAAAAAVLSSARNQAWPKDLCFVGELGLTGEVRRVQLADVRVDEARKLGFKRCVIPVGNLERVRAEVQGIDLVGIRRVDELTKLLG